MKFLRLSAALSATAISFLSGFHASANAQNTDDPCFMTTKSGSVVDLSESVCGMKKSAKAVSVNSNDKAFLKDYERNLMEYPDMRDVLLARVQQSPDQSINKAKSICDQLKAGFSIEEIQSKHGEEIFDREGSVNAAIINDLATNHYCPEFSNR